MDETLRASYVFTVKEYDGGSPFIVFEPRDGQQELLSSYLLSFDLPKGTKYKRAEEIADFLNTNLGDLGYTSLK